MHWQWAAAFVAAVAVNGPVGAQQVERSEGLAVAAKEAEAIPIETGIATVYGADMQGQPTASGEPYDRQGYTAAHRTLPLGTRVRVVNVASGQSVEVRVNDRWGGGGGRVLNVSERAAEAAGFGRSGTVDVRLEIVALGDNRRVAGPALAPSGSAGSGPAAPRLEEVVAAGAPPLARCQNEASILGLTEDYHARHVRACLQRTARASAPR
jgi:rare lipoprotein A (peptidoglycan hydrolase)